MLRLRLFFLLCFVVYCYAYCSFLCDVGLRGVNCVLVYCGLFLWFRLLLLIFVCGLCCSWFGGMLACVL